METRKSGREERSLPLRLTEFVSKKESDIQRRSAPTCPKLETKLLKRRLADRKLTAPTPKPVFFDSPVTLSPLYTPEKNLTYFDQVFSTNEKIGEGSFGQVFKARSREDGRLYAIKQMKNVHGIKYGYDEVKNYEKVGQHNKIVEYFMAWDELHVVHIQMEYCSISLDQYSLKNSIVENQLWDILYDILQALEHLHKRKLIHLDVKPGNIMMSQGYYKLCDFGCLIDLKQLNGRKTSTVSDGDAKYLALEVLSGTYTFAGDIFALGISLLELALNIELPSCGPLWQKIRSQGPPLSWFKEKGISHEFFAIDQKMMSYAHWERPTASKILRMAPLKRIMKRDEELQRKIYGPIEENVFDSNVININDNIVHTPRRPLHEIRSTSNRNSINDAIITTPNSIVNSTQRFVNRRALIRTRLAF